MLCKDSFDLFEWIGRKNTRWLLHIFFWFAVLVFYTFFFGYKNVNYKITFSFVTILLPVTIITTYFLNYVLMPRYLFTKRYGKFFLYLIYTMIVSFYIEMVTVIGIFVLVAELNLEALHPSNTNALILIAGMYLVVFLGAGVKLLNHYYKNQMEIQTLKKEKVEAELKFLKAQLHPHFLFNTLNNLYALTLEKSDKASDVVLKLSELLDYVLYECNAELVTLEKEIKQMENYIELEKLRYGDRLDVSFSYPKSFTKVTIPPMLFMTLLENSFKHGVSRTTKNAWIRMEIRQVSAELVFEIKNGMEKIKNTKPHVSGGIGLDNLKNRLNLIYKDQYELIINEDDDSYTAVLTLKTIPIS
jgi:two-component system, LytTR family, sensor kinase